MNEYGFHPFMLLNLRGTVHNPLPWPKDENKNEINATKFDYEAYNLGKFIYYLFKVLFFMQMGQQTS